MKYIEEYFLTKVWEEIITSWTNWLPLLVICILLYVYRSICVKNIGQKIGLNEPLLPFFPIARTVYRLDIVGAPRWQFLFLGSCGFGFSLLWRMLLSLANDTLANIVWVVYALVCLLISVMYYIKYYRTFKLHSALTLLVFIPGLNLITEAVDALLAFSSAFEERKIPVVAPSNPGRIAGIAGEYAGAEFELADGQELIIGRDGKQCNLVLTGSDAESVSNRHCSIRFSAYDRSYVVTDYSSNGTYDAKTGRKLGVSTKMWEGSTIYLADQRNVFRLG